MRGSRRARSARSPVTRETDCLGRLGGDEFAALLLEVEAVTVATLLARLRSCLPDGLAASAGAAFLPEESSTAEQLLELADRRLYADKPARAA